jgi:hypothetical protein
MLDFQKSWHLHSRGRFFASPMANATLCGRELLVKRVGLALWFPLKRKKTKGDTQSGAFHPGRVKLQPRGVVAAAQIRRNRSCHGGLRGFSGVFTARTRLGSGAVGAQRSVQIEVTKC